MTQVLRLLDFEGGSGLHVEAEVEFLKQEIKFSFNIFGSEISSIDIETLKPKDQRSRRHELWKKTCFELFWNESGKSYYEMNLSAGGDWQLYRFSDYRQEAEEWKSSVKDVEVHHSLQEFTISGWVPLLDGALSPTLFHPTTVLKKNGTTHFFAAKHPVGKPDFHDQKYWTPIG